MVVISMLLELVIDFMYIMFLMLLIVFFSGVVMVLVIIFGLVLGYFVCIWMFGGMIFGYLFIGSSGIVINLVIKIKIDSIVVKIGLLIKKWEKFMFWIF